MTDKVTQKHSNVYTALACAQLEFGQISKGATNPAFKSRYANLADVASVVIPTLARHGVAVLHYLTRDDLSAMRTEFVHGESDTRVFCDVPLIVDKNNMQGMKSATTYAKRIGLESLSGVAPEDDDGNAAAAAAPRVVSTRITAEQFQELRNLIEQAEADEAKLLAWLKARDLHEITSAQFDDASAMLRKKIAQREEAA